VSAGILATPTFALPISSGLLTKIHCEAIGIALWVFLWMINRTTKEVPTANGYAEGLVYGGRPIPANDIARDLGMATRTVHVHIERLVAGGYLRRIPQPQSCTPSNPHGDGLSSGYAVERSKKWKHRLRLATSEEPPSTSQESANPSQESANPSHAIRID
jgi:hypothetical protein